MAAAWRVVKRTRSRTAFDGEGARRFGGRWNSPRQRAVYASQSKALAALELLVHLETAERLPRLVAFSFEIDDPSIEHLDRERLPRGWRSFRGVTATRRLGDEWLASRRTVALAIPSVVIPEEWNFLLNPAHPDFPRLDFGRATPFLLDPRLR